MHGSDYALLPPTPKSAKELRAWAQRVRRLADLTADAEIHPRLLDFAANLERQARSLQAELEVT
jgi:hypothetical protein